MSPVYASKRRADEFQVLVDRQQPGDIADAQLRDLLLLVESLQDIEPVMPRADFSSSLRERLMVAAETELVSTGAAAKLAMPPRRTKRERRIAAAVGGFALVGASTGLAAAAQTALPGDALYPLKRAIENAHTGLTMGDEAKGSTLLSSAQDRLDELTQLSARGDDPAAMSQTLGDFTDQATQASDLLLADYAQSGHSDSIAELRDFTATSLDSLADLAPQVDGDAHDALIHAANVLTQIDAAAEDACASCGGAGIDDIPAVLASLGLRTPTPTTTFTLPGDTFTSTNTASASGTKTGKGGQGHKAGKKDGTVNLPTTGPDTGTSGDPLGDLGEAVTGGADGSTSTSNGGSGGGLLPNLPSSTDTSSGDPLGDLGDAIDDTVSGIGDALTP
jgi:hypothetical protein